MEFVEIGLITKAHGVKGDVKIIPHTFDMTRFSLLNEVTLLQKSGGQVYKIEKVKYQNKSVILKLNGIDNMSQAEGLRGSVIAIPASLALPLDEDEYYIGDIIGCIVIAEDKKVLGEITDVLETGANDVYVVKNEEGKEILIPSVKHCILNVDIPGKTVLIKLPGGLL